MPNVPTTLIQTYQLHNCTMHIVVLMAYYHYNNVRWSSASWTI